MTEAQAHIALNKYFEQHWTRAEELRSEWYVNPAFNKWRFFLDGEIIVLTCDEDGSVSEERRKASK